MANKLKLAIFVVAAFLFASCVAYADLPKLTKVLTADASDGYQIQFQGVYERETCLVHVTVKSPDKTEIMNGFFPCEVFEALTRMAREKNI